MSVRRRIATILILATVLLGTAGVYGFGWDWLTSAAGQTEGSAQAAGPTPVAQPVETPHPIPTPTPSPSERPAEKPAPSEPSESPAAPKPSAEPEPTLQPGPRLLGPGDTGPDVRELQARLRQIDWFNVDVTDFYGDVTTTAVSGFQAKRGFPVTGYVDQRTLDRLHEMTSEPSAAELDNTYDDVAEPTAAALDERCLTGRVLCIDKSSSSLRWVVDGQVQQTFDARFGREGMETREGVFTVNSKSRDHVSSIYDTPMPFAMFFSGGQAVHYSPDFAANGYNGASHGCVNIRDYNGIAALFDQVAVGDKVVVYWG